MTVYEKIDSVPEMTEGQVAHVMVNSSVITITFQERKRLGCVGCVFQKAQYIYCRNAKCTPINRKDGKIGIFVEVDTNDNDLSITEANWDFVDEYISESGKPYNELQSLLRTRMDEGEILSRDELMDYYRSLAMVYIDAVNNFTKRRDESNN